jgi:putative phage-type endonuclease
MKNGQLNEKPRSDSEEVTPEPCWDYSFKDEYTLYLEKLGEIIPQEAGEAAEWGHTLEPVVANKWHERVGSKLGITIEPFNYLLQSKTHPFMLANIDRLAKRGDSFGILEVKTASEYLNGEWANGEILSDGSGDGKVPPKYYAQLQHYFHVCGIGWGYFAALVGGNKLYSVYVERNDDYIRQLVEIEHLFTQRLELRIPPELNGSDTCRQLVGSLYKEHSEDFLETEDSTFREWLERRNLIKEHLDRMNEEHKQLTGPLEEELNLCETRLKAFIGENKGVTWNGWKVTWGIRAGRKSADIKLLEEKYPDIAAEVVKQGESYRQISVAKPKAKKGAKVS